MPRAQFKFIAAVAAFCAFLPLRAQELKAMAGPVPSTIHALQAPGLHNFFQLTDRIFSGSAPEDEAAFAALRDRGVKTIITVDGAKPDAATAARFGIRYVHLPIGYDGVPTNQAARLVKAVATIPGLIYIHCHHGMHRGPAGAAVVCMATAGWNADQAEAWLKLAGTATNYVGLYRSVQQFHPPDAAALARVSADFSEKSPVSPLADIMIQVDHHLDNLKLIKKSNYRPPPTQPDLDPAHEALLLDELFKELQRSPIPGSRAEDFRNKLTRAEQAATTLHNDLSTNPINATVADKTLQRTMDSCLACHRSYRD